MKVCLNCGGPADRGWTDDEEHERCCMCEVRLPDGLSTLAPEYIARLVKRAGELFEVSPRDILKRDERRAVARARAAVYAALMAETTVRTMTIAQLLNRHHRAIDCGARAARARAERDADYAARLALLRQEARRGH